MKIEVAKHARMAERGSSLLKLLQNDDTPILDLLIRESVQNSLDAASGKKDSVVVDIGTKEFAGDSLIPHMEGIEEGLEERYGGKKCKALYIADSNTVGLTGPFHAEEVEDYEYGNLQKLVYEISIPQQKEGAGGSWGLGKTVYFRFGIGLVFYYSRILTPNGEYEHRLAATMVEDEKSEKALIPSRDNKPKRGIAWWGQSSTDETTVPVTDEHEINNLLSVFSIEPFEGTETGTKIIIPFIEEEKLLPADKKTFWDNSIENYIKISLQRWYASRLDNQLYTYGCWLDARINGKRLTAEAMERFFQIMQGLYNKAAGAQDSSFLKNVDHTVADINLRIDFKVPSGGNAGKVAFAKLSASDLKMLPPENQYSPYVYINVEKARETGNPPIVAYLRKPAMIVSYEVEGVWCNDVPMALENEYIIALFVPNSQSEFKSDHLKEFGTLEQYLRRSEKADHTSWKDLSNTEKRVTVIARIQNNVAKAIREKYQKEDGEVAKGKKSLLSKSLAGKLLPPQNFGKKPGKGGGGGGGGGMGKHKKTNLQIVNQSFDDKGFLQLEFEYFSAKNQKSALELAVLSETGLMKGNTWEGSKGIGTQFPLEIKEFRITHFNNDEVSEILTDEKREGSSVPVKLIESSIYSSLCGVEFVSNGEKLLAKGIMKVQKTDPWIQASLSMASEEVTGNEQ